MFQLILWISMFDYFCALQSLELLNCPTSSIIETANDHLLPYPIFYNHTFVSSDILNITDSSLLSKEHKSYHCVIHGEQDPPMKDDTNAWGTRINKQREGLCVSPLCPVNDDNIKSVFSQLNWRFRADGLCNLKSIATSHQSQNQDRGHSSSMSKPEIQVLVFGGSMTVGQYCMHDCIEKDFQSDLGLPLSLLREEYNTSQLYCTWFGHLMRWMVHQFGHLVDFRFHNLAISGTGSKVMSSEVHILLLDRNITLGKNDLVFLDHSCNDLAQNTEGVEMLIRSLLRECNGVSARPTIIQMEQFPHDMRVYKDSYRPLAQHYQLLLFSYASAIQNEQSSRKPVAKDLYFWQLSKNMGHLHYDRNDLFDLIGSYQRHPPWHTHILIADMLGRFLMEIMDKSCTGESSAFIDKNSTVLPPMPIGINDERLEAPYSKALTDESLVCDTTRPYISLYQANNFIQPKNTSSYESHYQNEWLEYADYHMVSGWIMTANFSYLYELDAFLPQQQQQRQKELLIGNAGQITTAGVFSIYTALIFPLKEQIITPPISAGMEGNHKVGVSVHIEYLRTYRNAGSGTVHLCGRQIAEIDALAAQGQSTVRISVPQLLRYQLTEQDVQRCNTLLTASAEAAFNSSTSLSQHRDNVVNTMKSVSQSAAAVVIMHTGGVRTTGMHGDVRGNRKLKIMQVYICYLLPS